MNTDLLKYDASDMRELLRKKLLESGLYTDQIYPGSDTSILIDLFSWTFNVLTYILNENASDILFKDSSIYENLNKIVKLLSYKPKAYRTSRSEFSIELNDTSKFTDQTYECVIPKFSSISMDKADSFGNFITYSFMEDYRFNISKGMLELVDERPVLHNGIFSKYAFAEKSNGTCQPARQRRFAQGFFGSNAGELRRQPNHKLSG